MSTDFNPLDDPFIAPACHESLGILYQDDDLLVINKPSGLLSLSGKNPLNKDSVHYRLVQDFPTALMAHRLDFGTSGLMLVALNKAVNADLTKQFQNRQVSKIYEAILQGCLTQDSGLIDIPLTKDKDNFPYQKVCYDSGKSAQSHYRVLERMADRTRVEFTPITGRTHQLRVHSQAIGHPILGCDLYDNGSSFSMANRLLLHASQLEFTHPVSGQAMTVECPCPF